MGDSRLVYSTDQGRVCPSCQKPVTKLPVESILDRLDTALGQNSCAVLQAPPGAGKTTRVPLALLGKSWLAGKRILMLEPRRLATRAAARRMAESLGERVGQTVGYRMRLESRVGPETRIEVLTEGVLTRMLQSDPALEGVGLVIFDECHERSLAADLALALCLDIQGVLNERLRILAMSATLQSQSLSALMNRAPVITCTGKQFPVETVYAGPGSRTDLCGNVAAAVNAAFKKYSGSLLVFLPGAPEIRKVARLLEKSDLGANCKIAPLYGNLSRADQLQAIVPAGKGSRKIVLATDIAETSLTIEGIQVVVDGGFRRAPQFDVKSGLTRLTTLPVSRASADQRRGRAGRLGPGVCLRLWDQNRHHLLPAANRPEILEADLTSLALELTVWGVADPAKLKWLDPPPEAALENAGCLLESLGAVFLEGEGKIKVSTHGRKMAEMAVHPRLAHMLLMARKNGAGTLACKIAAILGERDFIRFKGSDYDADLRLRLDILDAFAAGRSFRDPGRNPGRDPGFEIDTGACRRILKTAAMFEKRLKINGSKSRRVDAGRLLAWAYPDRIAQQRPSSRRRYLLSNGRGARFNGFEPLCASSYLVVAALDGDRREARIFLAAGYDAADLTDQYGKEINQIEQIQWDRKQKAVSAVCLRTYGAIPLERTPLAKPSPEAVLTEMINGIRREGLACLPWTKALRAWQNRVLFLRRLWGHENGWPDLSDTALLATMEKWLAPYLDRVTRLKQLGGIDLKSALYGHLTWRRQQMLDELAPSHLNLPSGARVPIDYASDPPVAAARIQQLFGLTKTPAVAGGRQPLLLHLLSPAGRPMQITDDLAGFWNGSYHAVKKDLMARYPKHPWPEDPANAVATNRAKPRR